MKVCKCTLFACVPSRETSYSDAYLLCITSHYIEDLTQWSFNMKYMKRAFGEFPSFHMKLPRA